MPPLRSGAPNPIDVHVGGRVRLRRKQLDISQDRLAQALNLTFQQVQKYERGTNRISASRLFAIGRFLQAPVAWFFDGLEGGHTGEVADGWTAQPIDDFLRTAEGSELAAMYPALPPRQRRRILELVRTLAEPD